MMNGIRTLGYAVNSITNFVELLLLLVAIYWFFIPNKGDIWNLPKFLVSRLFFRR
jgi:hypothetical protein